jgi:hypothetical protein
MQFELIILKLSKSALTNFSLYIDCELNSESFNEISNKKIEFFVPGSKPIAEILKEIK